MGSLSALHWLILGAIVFVLFRIFSRGEASPVVCKACGHTGEPKSKVRGSLAIEAILWLCLIVPGLIYSIWRLSSRHKACAACGSAEVIPVDSPIGKKIIADLAAPPR